MIGLIKYLDERNRDIRTKRYELFHDLMRRISARGESMDEGIPLTQQVAAVYELQHFEEYAYASIPILEHLRNQFDQKQCPAVLMRAIDETMKKLKSKGIKRQS